MSLNHFVKRVEMNVGRGRWRDLVFLVCLVCLFSFKWALGVEILSKSKIEKCVKDSDSDGLNCTRKIIVNLAVPSGSSGGEASIVAELVEAEENATHAMQTLRTPPIITVNKSAAYAIYEITYIRDVPYKPMEYYVKTRKCEPDASAKIVKICERLRDESGHYIDVTQPVCCPCGPWRRAPSSCGNFFDKLVKGKANTAHCLRFPGDWFHIFGIGRRSLGFNVQIEVMKGSTRSEVIVGPENRTVLSSDNLLRVNLIGDFVGYTSIPSFEDFYLVIPRQGPSGQPQFLGSNFSMWMLLERVRFTLDGLECNKIGVSYEAFNGQPNFCSSPLWSCLHNQLWHFWENAGTHSFSIGITEALNTNLLIELNADDIEYVYQRSPGKILSVTIPTFEALTQFGTATITIKNIGKLEASYSLTFDCLEVVSKMEEQFFIMKPQEIATRAFKVYPTTDQAAKYECAAILKDSTFNEIDRAECQFTTTATILDNGSQISSDFGPPKGGINGIFAAIEKIWKNIWGSFTDFITGKSCRSKCSSFFDFGCHIQYICLSWIAMFCLLLLIFPTVIVLLWLLHQKGFFDPLYDWWEDHFAASTTNRAVMKRRETQLHHKHYHVNKHDDCLVQVHRERRNLHKRQSTDRYHAKHDYHDHHDHNQRHKHKNSSDYVWQGHSLQRKDKLHRKPKRDSLFDDKSGYLRAQMERLSTKGTPKNPRMYEVLEDQLRRQKHAKKREHLHFKRKANSGFR